MLRAHGFLPLALLAACAGPAPTVPARPEYSALAASLRETIRRQMADKNVPGLSIAILHDNSVLWAEGFGQAAPDLPATATTVYRMASISKLVTDTVAMQLVEEGALDLDAPVTTYLPEFAPDNPFGTEITLRHLMSHRAGLVREPPVGHYFDDTDPGLEAMVQSLNETSLVYQPDTRTKYSNAGIGVLGRVLEVTLGQPFPAIAQQRVLEPLGMKDSSFERPRRVDGRRSTGPMRTYDGREIPTPEFSFGFAPAADLESTVLDLLEFAKSWFPLADPYLLRQDTLRQMWEVPGSRGIGLGFLVGQLDGHLRVGHNGAAYGCASELAALPDQQLAVAVATSLDFANDFSTAIADHALRLLLAQSEGRPLPAYPDTIPVPLEEARTLLGRYDSPAFWMTLSLRDGELWMQPSHGMSARVRRRGDVLVTDGYLDMGSFEIRGWQDDPEILLVNGLRLTRQPDTPPLEELAAWTELIGEYGWDHNRLLVFEENGRLCILIEWLVQYPLATLGPDQFRLEDRGYYPGEPVTFFRGEDNSVTGVRIGGVLFPRVSIGPDEGVTFRIEPQHSPSELRRMAAIGTPPPQPAGLRDPDLQELQDLDPSIRYDIRYASTDNFMGMVFYPEAHAMLQRPAAEALVRAHRNLKQRGFGLLIHDAYRPWSVTKMFWDATPEDLRIFVANPDNGSRHNRGCAVDLSLYDLETGEPVIMVSGYDEFTPRAFPHYVGTTDNQRWHRELLRTAMEAEGFEVYEAEWWHFDYEQWREYPVLNLSLR